MPTFGDMKAKRRKPESVKVGSVAVKIYRRQKTIKTRRKDGTEVFNTYTVFEVADYTTGTRRFRSFNDRRKAVQEAEKLAGQISTGQTTAASMTNPQAASYGRAAEILRPTGASLELATTVYAKCWEILGGDFAIEAAQFYKLHRADAITHRTVAEVVAEAIESKRARGRSARYIGDLNARLNRFAKDFSVDVGSVTTADIARWLDDLRVAPQTAKNFRTIIGTLFSFAESRGYIFKGGNPVAGVERITTQADGVIEIYAPQEISAMLLAAPKDFLPMVALGAFGGLRTAEIQRLEWSNVDLAGGYIHISASQAKTASRRLVPIAPNLAKWLAPYAGQRGKVWKGEGRDLQEARNTTAGKSGVAWKRNGLRHSFCSYRLADIQSAAQVSLEAGNSPAMIFKHYRELVRPEAAKTWFAIAP